MTAAERSKVTLLLSDKNYNILRKVVEILLPGLGAFYFSLSQIWGLAYGEEVVGTLASLAIFLGLVLKLSERSYDKSELKYDGSLVVDHSDPAENTYEMEVDPPVDGVASKDELSLKVENVVRDESQ